ncbi:energy transducer TonB [Aliifodinibius salipaludis]|uniref:Energy transducer TonB n=2 Tax=Fodinibius salipaludis TaxID=2032627 RepID=A0A2A2G739_9BACT|nr:energy transducer TonB [Aliifodinibius salipaludis]
MRPDMKNPKYDLRTYYKLFWEVGLIVSLLIFIGLTKIDFDVKKSEITFKGEQEVIEMEEVVQTQQQDRPPPPPRPQVPVAVPNSEIIEDVEINIDAEIDMDEALDMPPPPQEEEAAEEEEEEDFFVSVEKMPKMKSSLAELQQNIVYPDRAQKAGIEGRVIVQFIVNEKGEVEDPRVIRGIGGGCDEEAVRVAKLAKFEPGEQRGVPVRVQYSLPIMFMLRK